LKIARLFASVTAVGLILAAMAGGALAYSGQVAGQVVISGPDFVIACGYDWTLKAHVTEAGTGNPIEGQPVHWAITDQPAGASDTLTDSDTVTDSNGDTHTKISVTAGVYGPRTVTATADDVTTQFQLDCEKDGLPPTSVATSTTTLDSGVNWMWIAAAGAVIAGFGIMGLRFARR